LAVAISNHRTHLETSGGWEQRNRWRLQTELDILLQTTLIADFRSHLPDGAYEQAVEDIFTRQVSPFQAVEKLVNRMKRDSS
jgi:putative protein kinase ArgK-like GTPase of G3E family